MILLHMRSEDTECISHCGSVLSCDAPFDTHHLMRIIFLNSSVCALTRTIDSLNSRVTSRSCACIMRNVCHAECMSKIRQWCIPDEGRTCASHTAYKSDKQTHVPPPHSRFYLSYRCQLHGSLVFQAQTPQCNGIQVYTRVYICMCFL